MAGSGGLVESALGSESASLIPGLDTILCFITFVESGLQRAPVVSMSYSL